MLFTYGVNPEMATDKSVFIVNYAYCFCTETVLILLKLNLQSLKLNSVYSVVGFGVHFCWVLSARLGCQC